MQALHSNPATEHLALNLHPDWICDQPPDKPAMDHRRCRPASGPRASPAAAAEESSLVSTTNSKASKGTASVIVLSDSERAAAAGESSLLWSTDDGADSTGVVSSKRKSTASPDGARLVECAQVL